MAYILKNGIKEFDVAFITSGHRYEMDSLVFEKFQSAFFLRYSNFLSMSDWKWSKTNPVFFVSKYLKNYGRKRPSNFWQIWAVAGWLIEKWPIFFVNLA